MKVVKFTYFDEFKCIGPECPDSCCKYWSIVLSKREYLDYKKMDCSPKLRIAMDGAFKRIKDGNDLQYVEMRVKENGNCPFLDDDSLCMLQKEKGEEALSLTCSVFPRLYKRVGDVAFTYSCNPTCCHVTEILMNHPEGLRLEEMDYDGSVNCINSGKYSSQTINSDWKGFSYYWNILNAEIDILQNRKFTIPERLLILGYFCKKTEDYMKMEETGKVISLSSMLLEDEMCRKIADSLKPDQSDDSAAGKSVDILYKMYLRLQNNETNHLKEMFNKVMDSIECTAEKSTSFDENGKSVVSYNIQLNRAEYDNHIRVYRSIENERPYILENLLVNLVFSQNMDEGVWVNFFALAVFYNTLKICVPAFLPEEYDDKALAYAITQAVKMVMNSNLAKEGTSQDFIHDNKFTLPYTAFLIC